MAFFSLYTPRLPKTQDLFFVQGILLDKSSGSSSHTEDACSSSTCLSKFHPMYCLPHWNASSLTAKALFTSVPLD